MSEVYDNWERLVEAVIDRERLRRLALCDSFSSYADSSSDLSSRFSFDHSSRERDDGYSTWGSSTDIINLILSKAIKSADRLIMAADDAASFKPECSQLKPKSENLVHLLRQVARAGKLVYDRPVLRIIYQAEKVLDKALALVLKCCGDSLVKRIFTIIPASAFFKISSKLDNSIADVSWLLSFSSEVTLALPPIASDDPVIAWIWNFIAVLYTGSACDRAEAAAELESLARDHDRYRKLIIEEGGVGPLLNLVMEGESEGQKNAAKAIGLLGADPESVEQILEAGVCQVFVQVLKENPHMKLQGTIAWAVSTLAEHYPGCQNLFSQSNIIPLLVTHLAFENLQDHRKYSVPSHDDDDERNLIPNLAEEEYTAPIKAYPKAMAARALCHLGKGNPPICRTIIEMGALLYFAAVLEKGPLFEEEVEYNCAMALMEITSVAENDTQLSSAILRDYTAYKAIVDQLFKVVDNAVKWESKLLCPCVRAIGNLAMSFGVTETRMMITPLVKLLDCEIETEVSSDACIALTKFASSKNYLHLNHSMAIIDAGSVMNLVRLVYSRKQILHIRALVLLCYLSVHVPDSKVLAKYEVFTALNGATSMQLQVDDDDVEKLLLEAIGKLRPYKYRS